LPPNEGVEGAPNAEGAGVEAPKAGVPAGAPKAGVALVPNAGAAGLLAPKVNPADVEAVGAAAPKEGVVPNV